MSDPDDLQRLIRLKRYETPGDGYYETFLENFKDRQRGEMLRASSRDLLLERVSMWWSESGGARYVPAGAMAALALGAGIYWVSTSENAASPTGPATQVAAVSEVKSDTTEGMEKIEEVIRLKLPQSAAKAPALDGRIAPEGVMTVGVKGRFREL